MLPNPNAGALYPIRILSAPLPFPVAAKVFPVLHWAAGGIGVLVLLLALGVSPSGAWLGAVTYAGSGVVVSEVYYPHVLPGMALLPWIIWTIRRPGGPLSRVAILSFLFALLLLAGDVFTVTLALLCSAVWILREEPAPDRRARFGELAGAVALGALAALPQIVATSLWIPETNRAVSGMPLREALQYCVSPWRLLELVIPYPFGSVWTLEDSSLWAFPVFRGKISGLFLTLYSGALGAIALVTLRRGGGRGARFARTVVLLALLLAVPGSFLPAAWEGWRSPIPLRNPEKVAVALAFGLALLVGLAFDALRRRARLPRWALILGVALAAAAVVAIRFPLAVARVALAVTGTPEPFLAAASREIPGSLLEAALLWLFTCLALALVRAGPVPGWAAWIGLGILTAVPLAATHRIPWTFREDEIFAPPAFVRYQRKVDPGNRFRTLGEMIYRPAAERVLDERNDPAHTEYARRNWIQHAQALWGRGTVLNHDFDNGDLSRIESLRKLSAVAARYRDAGPFFASLSLRWGTRLAEQPPMPGFLELRGDGLWAWDENPGALPALRIASGCREVAGPVEALREIPKLQFGEIVVETGSDGRTASGLGSVRILEESPGWLRLETEAPHPTWLFVLRGFWRHREVRIDGTEAEVFPAQVAFSGVSIPAGRHAIEWRERFPGGNVSWAGPILYLLALGLLFARDSRHGR